MAEPTVTDPKVYQEMMQYMSLKLQRPFTAAKIVMLVASGVKFLGKVKSMTGPEKKDLVLLALRETIKNTSFISETEKADILVVIDTLGDGLVDHLVQFANDAYTFIKRKCILRCSLCPSCKRSTSSPVSNDRSLEDYKILKDYLRLRLQRPITAPKIITVIAAGVKFMEEYKTLSGAEKKDIVLRVIRGLIMELDLSETEQSELITVLDTFGDATIDYLVEFGKNMYLEIKKRCCRLQV